MVDKETGLVEESKLNQIIRKVSRRADGSLRIQQDFSQCPSMAEQHTAHLTDINWLIKTYRPDELDAYLRARAAYRQEIVGHDFSQEPDLQGAKNIALQLKKDFEALPEKIREQFSNHVEFLKFIDNPRNQEKMIAMGLMTLKEIKKHTDPQINDDSNDEEKPTVSAKKASKKQEGPAQS